MVKKERIYKDMFFSITSSDMSFQTTWISKMILAKYLSQNSWEHSIFLDDLRDWHGKYGKCLRPIKLDRLNKVNSVF